MKTETQEIRDAVRRHLAERLVPGDDPSSLADDRPLITGGLMDSITTVALITFLEQEYGVTFEAHEIGIDHLDTVALIAETVAGKLGQG
jgi:acyl carrier protein